MRFQLIAILRHTLLAAILILLVPGSVCRSADQGTLRDGLKPLAKYIQDVLSFKEQSAVAIGEFVPRKPDENVRAGIAGELTNLLKQDFKLTIKADAPFHVSGHYALITTGNGLKVLKVTASIFDAQDNEVGQQPANVPFSDSAAPPVQQASSAGKPPGKKIAAKPKNSVEIKSTKVIAAALGVTGTVSEQGEQAERNKELQDRIAKPTVYLDGTKIRAYQGSPYAIEILVRKPLPDLGHPPRTLADYQGAVPCPPTEQDGMPFVDIKQGDVYEVKVYNDQEYDPAQPYEHDIAVSLSIDGLDQFHFSDVRLNGRPRYSWWFVYPKGHPAGPNERSYDGTLMIRGWHKSDGPVNNVLSFLVTDLGKGAAAGAGIKAQGKIGVIHSQFWRCGAKVGKSAATGFGVSQTIRQVEVKDIKVADAPFEFISVRYTRPDLPPAEAELSK